MKLDQLLAKAAGDGDSEARAVVEELLTKISGSVADMSKQAQTLADETVMEGRFQSAKTAEHLEAVAADQKKALSELEGRLMTQFDDRAKLMAELGEKVDACAADTKEAMLKLVEDARSKLDEERRKLETAMREGHEQLQNMVGDLGERIERGFSETAEQMKNGLAKLSDETRDESRRQSAKAAEHREAIATDHSAEIQDVKSRLDELKEVIVNSTADELPDIVRQKLDNPAMHLTVDQEIECLTACIALGRRKAVDTTAGCENLVVFLGNTGSGKSTLVGKGGKLAVQTKRSQTFTHSITPAHPPFESQL